ncbi:hypothetical protein [Streptomyces sp. CB03911]|uniref:hypothetical protein n=1 Tax=Streptomyces sp. CB03911 TaxID=1804758 RepID=UPI000939A0D8|nr:hypothetical protein [Streptomyces sp. CB03911]OKI14235.1 hypothetical protein A6A07_13880 [Streptomyces sp. CB03911]
MTWNWGDAPAWVACALSIIAVLMSWRGQRRANAAAERSALAAERALALQQQQAAAAAAAAVPKPDFAIERGENSSYLLRNVGTANATGVTVDPESAPDGAADLPSGARIFVGAAETMIIAGSLAGRLPTELLVKWDGQPTWVHVPIPAQ